MKEEERVKKDEERRRKECEHNLPMMTEKREKDRIRTEDERL